jgi:hypothetical protein
MVYWNKSGAKRRTDTGYKRGSYKRKPLETRGKIHRESKVMTAFWQAHTMDDMITKTPKEIDALVETFMNEFQAKNIKRLISWWYPETIVIANFK